MASRARKRNMSHYAATEAARTQRLSNKLLGKDKKEGEDNEEIKEEQIEEEPKKISTSGYRGSRKEQWRTARGMSARPKGSTKAKRNTRRR
ncbi:hypothetical protein I307_03103 [Cryptococcus deuterogattii 99/473]|nr:hypothetical protein L804_02323 [Cryptococcus deuterogattii 2001/935-1]KIY57609.1 hypothetical protein I307_03103 [Cryptococcus deuterogattii 99/473]